MADEIKNQIQFPQRPLWKFVPRLLWIIFGVFILLLVVTRSYSGVPLLLGAIIAVLLYKLTKKLVVGRSREIRVAAWILFALAVYGAYATIWWQWGVVRIELLRYSLEQPDKAFQRLLAKDVYGSKTSPQETYAMYLDALRKGDIDLAVKYFVPGNDQKNRKEFFEKLKVLGSLEKWVAALCNADQLTEIAPRAEWMGGIRKSFECPFTVREPIDMGYSGYQDRDHFILQPGVSTTTEDFVFIESSGLWKIPVDY